jgi:leader peptidase (prepilin peptidase) / N-methyltransferase
MGRVGLDLEVKLDGYFYFVCFLFGLIFGSFGNVVIWRLPRGESLSTPPSHCPSCDAPIASYDNIPLVSWVVLRGKCRACKAPIAIRYPTVELLSGLLWLAAAVHFGFTVRCAFAIVFFYVLMLLAFIDYDTMRLPNSLVGVLAVVGAVGVLYSQLSGRPAVPLLIAGGGIVAAPVVSAVLGVLFAAGTMLVIAAAYSRIRGAQGFGAGDIKLLAVIGVFLGPYALLAQLLASLFGVVFGVVASKRSEEGMMHRFPFGPFLAAAAVAVALCGEPLVEAYARLLRIG